MIGQLLHLSRFVKSEFENLLINSTISKLKSYIKEDNLSFLLDSPDQTNPGSREGFPISIIQKLNKQEIEGTNERIILNYDDFKQLLKVFIEEKEELKEIQLIQMEHYLLSKFSFPISTEYFRNQKIQEQEKIKQIKQNFQRLSVNFEHENYQTNLEELEANSLDNVEKYFNLRQQEALFVLQSEKKIYKLDQELARLPTSIWHYTPLRKFYSLCKHAFPKIMQMRDGNIALPRREEINGQCFKKHIKGAGRMGRRLFLTEKLRFSKTQLKYYEYLRRAMNWKILALHIWNSKQDRTKKKLQKVVQLLSISRFKEILSFQRQRQPNRVQEISFEEGKGTGQVSRILEGFIRCRFKIFNEVRKGYLCLRQYYIQFKGTKNKAIDLPSILFILVRKEKKQGQISIFRQNGENLVFEFDSNKDIDQFIQRARYSYKGIQIIENIQKELKKSQIQDKWKFSKISNFDYLFLLNNASGRSIYCDQQLPIFPCFYQEDIEQLETFQTISSSRSVFSREQTKKSFKISHSLKRSVSMIGLNPDSPLKRSAAFNIRGSVGSSKQIQQDRPIITAEMFYSPLSLQNFNLECQLNSKPKYFSVANLNSKEAHQFIQRHRRLLESEEVSKILNEFIDLQFGANQDKNMALEKSKPLKLFTSSHPKKHIRRSNQQEDSKNEFYHQPVFNITDETKFINDCSCIQRRPQFIWEKSFQMEKSLILQIREKIRISQHYYGPQVLHFQILQLEEKFFGNFAAKSQSLVYYCQAPFKKPSFLALSNSVIATWNYFDNKIRILSISNKPQYKKSRVKILEVSQELSFHDGFIETAATDDGWFVTGSENGLVIVWKYIDGKLILIRHFCDHLCSVKKVAISSQLNIFSSLDKDGNCIVRHLTTFEYICSFSAFTPFKDERIESIIISKHGYLVFWIHNSSEDSICTFSCNGELIASTSFQESITTLALDNSHDFLYIVQKDQYIKALNIITLVMQTNNKTIPPYLWKINQRQDQRAKYLKDLISIVPLEDAFIFITQSEVKEILMPNRKLERMLFGAGYT